jgi:hypothetical protein
MPASRLASTNMARKELLSHQVRADTGRFVPTAIQPNRRKHLMDPKQRCVRSTPRVLLAAAVSAAILAARVNSAAADISLPPVTVGVGVQTGFYSCDHDCIYSPGVVAPGDSSVSGFALDSIRLYINGSVTDQIKLTFDTEYTGGTNNVEVMDAIGRFEFSDSVNIWAGRFLPPSDRANLYGPYYANDWTPYADGVADYYPNVAVGRDNGVAYWGDFGLAKVQLGVFDGESLKGSTAVADPSKLVYAGRVTLDFWDKEKGYYFNGTYYGDKDLLALGLAAQNQDSKTAFSLDGLMEKKLANLGAVTVEAEYQKDNGLNSNGFNNAASHGWYGLASYLFPQVIGIGKFQLLEKYSQKTYDSTATTDSAEIKTNEVNVNYIIKEFSARVGAYYLTQTSDIPAAVSPKEFGIKLQLQM